MEYCQWSTAIAAFLSSRMSILDISLRTNCLISNGPIQFMSFMDNLGFVRPGSPARSSRAPDLTGPMAPLEIDLPSLVRTDVDVSSLQDILDDWMTGTMDP